MICATIKPTVRFLSNKTFITLLKLFPNNEMKYLVFSETANISLDFAHSFLLSCVKPSASF